MRQVVTWRGLTDWVTTQNCWFFENKNQPCHADAFTSAYRHTTTRLHSLFFPLKGLVQFWRAEQVANSANDFQLTTLNQPFLLSGYFWKNPISEGICSYRMKTRDVIITGDGRGGGPISRVFKNNRMEFTPDVAYYSYEEYPQQDTALSCLIKSSLIVPLSDSYGRTVGVIEFVSQFDWPLYLMFASLPTLPAGTYDLKYSVEEDLILLTCDEDVQYYISC